MKRIGICLIIPFLLLSCQKQDDGINFESLLKEMNDLARLSELPGQPYHTIQFSSYDRRSTKSSEPSWYSNADGFGNEPIPGFEKVLKEPGDDGIGEYLMCDIRKPGVLLRLWTAGISGKVRVYLDDMDQPIFDGKADDFFWRTMDVLSENEMSIDSFPSYRQFDAVYFPIPFAKGCRIEWVGNIKQIHFYHLGFRIYAPGTKIKSLDKNDILKNKEEIVKISEALRGGNDSDMAKPKNEFPLAIEIPTASAKDVFVKNKGAAIERMELKLKAENYENALRQNILKIYFDDAMDPQVRAPLGDFFGSAPGIWPFSSLPFSVENDSTLVCKFFMPFKSEVRVEIENRSDEAVIISGKIYTGKYKWVDKRSMYFYAQWKMDHDLTAKNMDDGQSGVGDINYLDIKGVGRIIGASASIYNPSNVPTSWGNWWGEGDEKIFIDQDTFPSFFGTGSEDYYNYSWSSSKLFSYPYCGQPRNDGPGNRGYAANYRWHIIDDIPFTEKAVFNMELWSHGTVPGFSYGRIGYFYGLPGLRMETKKISQDEIRDIDYKNWSPEAYAGSGGYHFIQAEELIPIRAELKVENCRICSDGSLVMWEPVKEGDSFSFNIKSEKQLEKTNIGFTVLQQPSGGKISVFINGSPVKFRGKDTIDLLSAHPVLENYIAGDVRLKKGNNEIKFVSWSSGENKKVGVDFIWLRN